MYKKTTLKNGLRIITVPSNNTQTATILVLVGTGSKYENRDISGISHFLEHMMLKGTRNMPTEMDVFRVIDEIGGISNAFTGQDVTGYWVKIQASKFKTALDWLSEVFLEPSLNAQDMEKERGTIIEEINMFHDHPMRYIGTLWGQVLYGDQPAGWDIAGTKETVSKISRQDLIDYRLEHYVAQNTIVCVAGNFDEEKALVDIEKNFAKLVTRSSVLKPKVTENQQNPQVLVYNKETTQTHVALGVRAYNIFHPRRYELEILGNVLGGMMSSRMFEEVRIKRGLAYDVHVETMLDPESGSLATFANLDSSRMEEGIKVILEQYKKIVKEGITSQELRRSKDNYIGKGKIILESSNAQASYYGEQELLEKQIREPEDIYRQIEKIELQSIQEVAADIFKPGNLNLAVIGPYNNDERFKKLIENVL